MNITVLLCVAVILLALVILWPSKPRTRSANAYHQTIAELGIPLSASLGAMLADSTGVQLNAPTKMDYDLLHRELTDDPLDLRYKELGQDYSAICAILNAVTLLPNDKAQGTVPKQWTLTDFLGAATNAEAMEICRVPALVDRIERAVNANNRADMVTLFGLVAPMLSDATQKAIATMLAATVLDPAYSATVPGTSRAADIGLPEVKPTDVQMVL